jgi:polar amino acid transport system permease protein
MIELIRNYWLYFLIGQYPDGPLGGLALTLVLGTAALLLALPVGVVLGLARASNKRAARWPAGVLVYTVRGTPLLMVIFWAYFFLPALTGHQNTQFTTMLAALVVFNGAYLAETVRAGIQGLPRGQVEAARCLGLTYGQTLRHVILPQALRNMLPSLVSQMVTTIKETSLGYIIGVSEVSFIASQINAQVIIRPAEVYATLALTYFVLCFSLARLGRALEKRLERSRLPRLLEEAR